MMHDTKDGVGYNTLNQLYKYHNGNIETIKEEISYLMKQKSYSTENIARCFTGSYFKYMEHEKPNEEILNDINEAISYSTQEHSVLAPNIIKGFFEGLYDLEYTYTEIKEQAKSLMQKDPDSAYNIAKCFTLSYFKHSNKPKQEVAAEQAKVLIDAFPESEYDITKGFFKGLYELNYDSNEIGEQAVLLTQEKPELKDIINTIIFDSCFERFKDENPEQHVKEQAKVLMQKDPDSTPDIIADFFDSCLKHFKVENPKQFIGEQAESLIREDPNLASNIMMGLVFCCYGCSENPEQHAREQAKVLIDAFPESEYDITKGFFKGLYELNYDSNEIGEQAVLLTQEKPELKDIINTIIFDSCFERFKDENPEQHVKEQAKVLMQKDPDSTPDIIADFFDSCLKHFKVENPKQFIGEQAESLIREDPNLASNIMMGLVLYCCKFLEDINHIEHLEQDAREQAESLIDAFPGLKQDITKGFVKGFYELGYGSEEIKEQATTLIQNIAKKDERKISEEIDELFEPKKEEEKRKNCNCDSLSKISTKGDESPTQHIQAESQQNAKKSKQSVRCL